MSTYYERPVQREPSCAASGLLLILLLAALIGLAVWRFWPAGAGTGLNPQAEPRPVAARGDLSGIEQENIDVYKKMSPCVVHVDNLVEGRGFSLNLQEVPQGTGSGFIWDEDGHIVTNYHVVKGANAARVTLADQSTYAAQNVWAYPDKDIAVIWIQAPRSKLRPILIGTSHDLKVGQITYAIGNPFGLDHTMTTGIVSALDREIQSVTGRPIRGLIQTSAAINPGNSGGPLLDSAGRLIGMTTAIISPSGAFAGIGFAIPVDEINQVVPQLIQHGKVVKPMLGINVAKDQLAEQLGVDEGVLILKVVPNGPAAEAGLRGTSQTRSGQIQVGDVIVAIDGKPVKNAKDLYNIMDQYKVGDTVTVTVTRDGEKKDFKVTLGEAPQQ
jgi:S1-C subfamily serine protease